MLTVFSAVFTLFRSPVAIGIGVIARVAASAWGAYLVIDSRATARAERVCAVELQESQSQMLYDLLAAQEEAHQFHLAEIERGERISAELSKTQRRLNDTKTEYLAYANGITGNCSADVGRMLMSWPPRDSDRETSEDTAPSTPSDPADTVAASAIAANIAINRWAFDSNYAQCSALLGWHTKPEGPVK